MLGVAGADRHGSCSLRGRPNRRQRSDESAPFLKRREGEEITMLWTILAILLVLWLLGVVGSVGGSLIHLLLVVAAIVLLVQLLTGRRPVV